ncbi:DNA helicase [Tanacetum coccineum]
MEKQYPFGNKNLPNKSNGENRVCLNVLSEARNANPLALGASFESLSAYGGNSDSLGVSQLLVFPHATQQLFQVDGSSNIQTSATQCHMVGEAHVGQPIGQGNARPRSNAALKEVPADASGCVSYNYKTDADSDVFNRYSQLRARNVVAQLSPDLSQRTDGAMVGSSVENMQAIKNESTTFMPPILILHVLILHFQTPRKEHANRLTQQYPQATSLRGDNVNTVENTPSIHNEVKNSIFLTTEGTDDLVELRVAMGKAVVLPIMSVNILLTPYPDYVAWLHGYEIVTSNVAIVGLHSGMGNALKVTQTGEDLNITYVRWKALPTIRGLYDVISRGERDGHEVGGRIILPMSFTRGTRYMYAHYLDALAIFRKLGNPQFFITFTCNVNWLEIKICMAHYLEHTTSDRAYVVCRVFKQKIKLFVSFLKKERTFRDVTGGIILTISLEFQKRGLPHCHTLLWVDSASKYKVLKMLIISFWATDAASQKNSHPKHFLTTKGMYTIKEETLVYNEEPIQLRQQLYGPIQSPLGESPSAAGPLWPPVDEIPNYLEGRFVCAHEAYWGIFKFDIHCREPTV